MTKTDLIEKLYEENYCTKAPVFKASKNLKESVNA